LSQQKTARPRLPPRRHSRQFGPLRQLMSPIRRDVRTTCKASRFTAAAAGQIFQGGPGPVSGPAFALAPRTAPAARRPGSRSRTRPRRRCGARLRSNGAAVRGRLPVQIVAFMVSRSELRPRARMRAAVDGRAAPIKSPSLTPGWQNARVGNLERVMHSNLPGKRVRRLPF
jgi:hypothetical protein